MTPLAIRHRVHALRSEGWPQSRIAEACGISVRTVQRLLQRGLQDLQRRPGSGNPGKIHEAESHCLEEYHQAHPDAFLHEYVAHLEEHCQVRVSEMTICRHLRKLRLTLKKNGFSLGASPSRDGRSNTMNTSSKSERSR
jgi:transposase